jgi:hypothetical protein
MIEADARTLSECLRRDFPSPRPVSIPDWRQTPASRIIDCVLSLRKSYEKVVKPRVKRFGERHPDVVTCSDLRSLIDTFPSADAFHKDVLTMASPGKAVMLVGVLDYLIDIQQRFDGETEEDRLTAWARWARPGDHLMLDVPGFKLAGFQYLRMLFGAQTTKPDVHILAYVGEALGRPPASRPSEQVRAVYTVERAGEMLDVPVRSIDVAIWEHRTGHSTTS